MAMFDDAGVTKAQVNTERDSQPISLSAIERGSGDPGLWACYPLGPPDRMRFYVLHKGALSFGRAADCPVRLNDDKVSRLHAKVWRRSDYCEVEDCGSTNGVYVNGKRERRRQLVHGDILRMGSSLFRFVSQGPTSTDREYPIEQDELLLGPSLASLAQLIGRAAKSDLAVLVSGPTGSGKELVAQRLHRQSDRAKGPFVPVNCAALPREVFESELFGHEKGAFSGAHLRHAGLIRQAHRGTLFLDEVGELDLDCQAKLLRVLEDHRVRAVGAVEAQDVDIRVVSATNRPIHEAIKHQSFRSDLYTRLAELPIELPALRERAEDIPALVARFVGDASSSMRVSVKAIERLCCFEWPYNVRQLRSCVRRALVLAGDAPRLEPCHFSLDSQEAAELPSTESGDKTAVLRPEDARLAQELRVTLQRCVGDTQLAAEELGISRSQLYRRAARLGISAASFRQSGRGPV